jgi:antitoxin component of MazEF toxin-antitoxin module
MIIVPIVPVGNSRGIRIPKKLIEALGFPNAVNLDVKDGILIAYPISSPRAGWDDPAVWGDTRLTDEDTEWLNAGLLADEDAAA